MKNKLMKAKASISTAVTAASIAIAPMVAFAYTADPFAKMDGVIGLILRITKYLGAVMGIWGAIELGMGFIQEGQAEKKTKGAMWLIAGIVVAGAGFILGPSGLGLIS